MKKRIDYYKIKKLPKINDVYNYDHPHSFNWDNIHKFIDDVLSCKKTTIPVYDYTISNYTDKTIEIPNDNDVFIFEGMYSLYNKELNEKADLKLYIDTELDECIIRRIQRDIIDRKRTLESIIKQWREVVKPMYTQYIWNLRVNADLIIPSPSDYSISLALIESGIKGKFKNNETK